MPKALIFTGWYSKPTDNWYGWLKTELEAKGYEVSIPELPTILTDKPDLKQILAYLFSNFEITPDTSLIGHSLGCLVAYRLAEQKQVNTILTVSGWDFNDLTEEHSLFWDNALDHQKIIENSKKIICVSSDSDPYYTAATTIDMAKRFKGESLILNYGGHFGSKDNISQIPELLNYL